MHPTGKVTVITGLLAPRPGARHVLVADRRERARHPVRGGRGRPRRHRVAPYGLGTYGSRSLAVGGHGALPAARRCKDKARQVAAHMLECAADDLEWTDGRWQVKGSPDGKTIRSRVRGLGRHRCPRHRAGPRGDDVLRPAELHVPVRHARLRGRDRRRDRQGRDRALHRGRRLRQRDQPDDRRGQVHGGVVQSIAQALFEETVYDEDGQIAHRLARGLHDARRAADSPRSNSTAR